MKLLVVLIVIILLAITVSGSPPSISQQPMVVTAEPAIFEGSVQGHVFADRTNAGIPGARVWLINSTNHNTTYGTTITGTGGYYYFVGVVPMGDNAYRLKAQKGNDTGYSSSFGVTTLENKSVDVYIRMSPASVTISTTRNYVVADGSDRIGITALVRDSLGRPVAGGHSVTFTATCDRPGSYGSIVPAHAVTDGEGRAGARYGRVPTAGSASFVTIGAYDGAGVGSSISIDIRAPDNTPPVTALKVTGEPDNAGGFISDVTATLTADDPGGWGVNETYYRIGDAGWTRYTSPITVSSEGGSTIYYYSTDMAGNAEMPKSRTVMIHKK